jgi:pSer/pThr/pTyr-binding forkhead associated (FHA) protein
MNVKLLVIQGRPNGKIVRFGPGDYFLGRGPECHLRFNSDWVSRQHCQIHIGDAQAVLRDLGSRNGTLVNGVLIAGEQILADKDQVQIGPVVFEVSLDEGNAPTGSSTTLLPAEDEATRPARPGPDSTARHPPFLDRD